MKKHTFLFVLAAVLIILSTAVPVLAYFTATVHVKGSRTISLGSSAQMEENFGSWQKKIVVRADDDSQPVYVRVRAFAGSTFELEYDSDGSWYDGGDGFWYYTEILNAGENTSELVVTIKNIPDDPAAGDAFSIAVIQEYTPVRYTSSGEAYSDWDSQLETVMEGGN